MVSKFLLAASLLSSVAMCDMYIQSIRGSNNRLDEANRDRANGNRLFDSQNNDRGGYNNGKLSFYVGEQVPISWSNQHGSSIYQMKDTEIVIQYSCDSLMRDGTTTTRIPTVPTQCANFDCDTDVEYGRHESWTDYMYCRATARNMGLFTANQNLRNRNAATHTRQNPQGTRRGYECPEERDYYPYWRPTMWKDVAVYTNAPQRCGAYQAESENVKGRGMCLYNDIYWYDVLEGYVANPTGELPITEEECNQGGEEHAFVNPRDPLNGTLPKYGWAEFESWGIDAPECLTSSATRANHLGTIGGRSYYTYPWVVPDDVSSESETCCVLRARYNITTNDYQAWESESSVGPGLDYMNNTKNIPLDDELLGFNRDNPNADDDPAWVKIWENFKLELDDIVDSFNGDRDSDEQKQSRGYVFVNNPRVDPFGKDYPDSADVAGERVQLQLAINTNQFGRTFQDRTHCFQIKEKPDYVGEENIKLLTVQGKRGNIVQTFPGTEYFFIPEPLKIGAGDYVHFCWTGSNTNPNNNDGQGKQGTDRSNICPMTQAQYDKSEYSEVDGNINYGIGDLGNNYPDYVQEPPYGIADYYYYANKRDVTPSNMGGLSTDILAAICTTRRIDDQQQLDYGNMEELDDAGTTFCTEPVQVTETGIWNFLCTRNNNFSNRSQKGTMEVQAGESLQATIGSGGATIQAGAGNAQLIVQGGMVEETSTLLVEVTTWAKTGEESTIVEITGFDGGEFNADSLTDNGWLELWIPYTPKSMHTPFAERKADDDSSWKFHSTASMEYDSSYDTYYAVVNISEGGYYQAVNELDWGMLLVFIVFVLAFVGCALVLMVKKCKQ